MLNSYVPDPKRSRLDLLVRRALLKIYLRIDTVVRPQLIARLAEPLYGGLHPSNVFHYRSGLFRRHLSQDDVICDIACGTGKMLYELSPHVKTGYGIERAPANLKLCAAHLRPNLTFIEGDIFAFDYGRFRESTGCNVGVLSHILEHIDDAPGFLRMAGFPRLLICVPSEETWEPQLLKELGLSHLSDSTHFREYTEALLEQHVTDAEYRVDALTHNSDGDIFCAASMS